MYAGRGDTSKERIQSESRARTAWAAPVKTHYLGLGSPLLTGGVTKVSVQEPARPTLQCRTAPRVTGVRKSSLKLMAGEHVNVAKASNFSNNLLAISHLVTRWPVLRRGTQAPRGTFVVGGIGETDTRSDCKHRFSMRQLATK